MNSWDKAIKMIDSANSYQKLEAKIKSTKDPYAMHSLLRDLEDAYTDGDISMAQLKQLKSLADSILSKLNGR